MRIKFSAEGEEGRPNVSRSDGETDVTDVKEAEGEGVGGWV